MSLQTQTRIPDVLLIEDSLADAELARQGFRDSQYEMRIHHVETGEQALTFLRKEGKHATSPSPDLILLDLNLPGMKGQEVLAEIMRDVALAHLPVIILSTGVLESEIQELYRLRANSYIAKPDNYSEFVRVTKGISEYWFHLVMLPQTSA